MQERKVQAASSFLEIGVAAASRDALRAVLSYQHAVTHSQRACTMFRLGCLRESRLFEVVRAFQLCRSCHMQCPRYTYLVQRYDTFLMQRYDTFLVQRYDTFLV